MRVLALDYGSARCGCALSDPSGTIATPIAPVENAGSRRGIAILSALAREHGAELVLVGLPLALSGRETAQTREAREFSQRLQRRLGSEIPVELYDERFTTRIAQRTPASAGSSEDSRAAALLLEDWLTARSR